MHALPAIRFCTDNSQQAKTQLNLAAVDPSAASKPRVIVPPRCGQHSQSVRIINDGQGQPGSVQVGPQIVHCPVHHGSAVVLRHRLGNDLAGCLDGN